MKNVKRKVTIGSFSFKLKYH